MPHQTPEFPPLPADRLLAAIVDSSNDAIVSKTLDGIITSWNRAAIRIFGYQPDEVIGKHITLLFPPDRLSEEAVLLGEIRQGKRVEHYETVRRNKAGQLLNVSVTLSPIRDQSGTIVGASKIARDITARTLEREEMRRLNERLKEVDRLKSEFLASMSHELRTPLNSIIGFTGIILQELPGPINEEQKKQLNMVYKSARHLLSLINDLLDVSRVESGKVELAIEKFDPASVLEEVVRDLAPLAAQQGLTLSSDLQTPAEIETDRKRFYQILLNLAGNAVKFTHQGGVKIIARTGENDLTISVEDSGIGIHPEQMRSLFGAFQQGEGATRRKYEGTGLGLYLSKKLVTLLGGDIWAESEPGKGSRFAFRIPLRREGPRV